jgi:hypothetical protein
MLILSLDNDLDGDFGEDYGGDKISSECYIFH